VTAADDDAAHTHDGVTHAGVGLRGHGHHRVGGQQHDRRQFSVKVGTVMEDSPIPLDKWMVAIWLLSNAKNGISSYELHRAIGITQKSAWFLLHRIRLAMQDDTTTQIGGHVERDRARGGAVQRRDRPGHLSERRLCHPLAAPPLLDRGDAAKARVEPHDGRALLGGDRELDMMELEGENPPRQAGSRGEETTATHAQLAAIERRGKQWTRGDRLRTALMAFSICAFIASMLKLAPGCIGGKSTKVRPSFATSCFAASVSERRCSAAVA